MAEQERAEMYSVAYVAEESNEAAIQKLAGRIKHRELLTPAWFELGVSLGRLARLLGMEDGADAGRREDSIGHVGETLWDAEEKHPVARTIVDLAKVSCCMRMIHEYMTWRVDHVTRGESILALTRNNREMDENEVVYRCDGFEESLGALVNAVLPWKEAMQLSEPRVLVKHIAVVLKSQPIKGEDGLRPNRQTCLVFNYLQALGKHMDELNTAELLNEMRDNSVIILALYEVLRAANLNDPNALGHAERGLRALCAIADNEDFQTTWQEHFPTEQDMEAFTSLDEAVVKPMIEKKPELRRELRPLTDLINRVGRRR
jgi:hypothetical protein